MSAPTVPATSQVDEPAVSTPKVDMAALKRKSVRGGTVTMLSQGISVAIQVTSTITLARLLSPQDYGMMAMVTAITSFAGLFRDLGLSAAAIQKGTLNHAQMSNLFWLNVGMGGTLTSLTLAGSPLVAKLYGHSELATLTAMLSANFLIGSLGTQHGALLQRQLQFGRKALTSIAGSAASLAVSLILALNGQSYWALAWGSIAGGAVTTGLLFALSPFRPGGWTPAAGMRSMLTFGANVTTFDVINYIHRNIDNFLIGKFWGAAALGEYSRAYSLLLFPIHAIRGPINAVAFPALSRLQDQPIAYRTYYRRITQLLAYASMPLTAFFFTSSPPLINILLGDNWSDVSPIFSTLAIAAFIQPVSGLRGTVLLSRGQGGQYVKWGILNAASVTIGFIAGIPWGPIGVAASYAITNYLLLIPSLAIAFKNSPLRYRDFFEPLIVPATASLGATAICSLLPLRAATENSDLLHLGVIAATFGATFLALTAILPGGRSELQSIAVLFLRGKPTKAVQ